MAKPLMNRLLLENSNKPDEQASNASKKKPVPEWNLEESIIAWETPKKSEDVRKQVHQITELKDINKATCRVLFRKVAKGLDAKDFVIA